MTKTAIIRPTLPVDRVREWLHNHPKAHSFFAVPTHLFAHNDGTIQTAQRVVVGHWRLLANSRIEVTVR